MINYQNSKIYKIVCRKNGYVYIGSTCQKYLSTRINGHISQNNKSNNKCRSSIILDEDDYYYELIENYPCNNIHELSNRERYHIETTPNCINYNMPGRKLKANNTYYSRSDGTIKSQQNYYEKIKNTDDYKNKQNKRAKKYYDNNKDLISQRRKAKYQLKKQQQQQQNLINNQTPTQ